MLEHRDVLQLYNTRKPDIVRYDPVTKSTEILEITICCNLHFEQALKGKHEKDLHLWNVLENLEFKVKMHVLYFGSLGNIPINCSKMIQRIYKNSEKAKKCIKIVLYIHHYWSKLYLAK